MFPKKIYALLPFIYIASGIYTFIQLGNDLGQAAGVVLIAAGLIVVYMRYSAT
ncbi:MAG: hypothetical protein MJK13_08815 [Pseudomonadales bacterium]|nr:hypothetical protein [Pseudomonadales bacterium]MCJ8340601.1 hypothetical protein [Pseudomonadales bacterium]NRA15264.1 hypothetical protein [Oceanospirillaceae bacterium]